MAGHYCARLRWPLQGMACFHLYMTVLDFWRASADLAADQRQCYLWRAVTRTAVSNYAAASTFFEAGATATVRGGAVADIVRGGAVGDRVHGVGRGLTGVLLLVYVSVWWR